MTKQQPTEQQQAIQAAVGKSLRDIRMARNLNVQQVANNYTRLRGADTDRTNDAPYISRVENGKTMPSPNTLKQIAKAYRATEDETNNLLIIAGYLPEALDNVALVLRSASKTISAQGREQIAEFVAKIESKYAKPKEEILAQGSAVDVVMNVVSKLIPDADEESRDKVRRALEDMCG